MKRINITLADIAERKNLLLAVYKAAKAKRNRTDVSAFLEDIDSELNQLAVDILQQRLPYGQYRKFLIHDPKKRLIHAACFTDRVFHHALMNLAGPVLEKAMTPKSYACRVDMGVHKAVQQVQINCQKYYCYCKIDIDSYFPSINHEVLHKLLMRRFKGRDINRQFKRIINSYQTRLGSGLPIGSLTSQYFANYYLDECDRWLAVHPLVQANIRYMDDMIWWCQSTGNARQVLLEIKQYLLSQRYLTVKKNVQIQPCKQGVTFCGSRITQGAIRLSRRNKRNFQQRRIYWEQVYSNGEINIGQLQSNVASVLAITTQTDSLQWRRNNLQRHPALNV